MARKLPFNLNKAVVVLGNSDPVLQQAIVKLGLCTYSLRDDRSPFEALLRTIIYQQLAGSAARVIHQRVLAITGDDKPDPKLLLRRRVSTLAKAGLSRNKIAAVRDLAERCTNGQIPSLEKMKKMDDAEITATLTQIRGIGPWSAQMLLMFNLGRPDIFPVTDLGIKKGYKAIFGLRKLPSEKTMHRKGQNWQPWRSVASWYLWRAVDGPDAW